MSFLKLSYDQESDDEISSMRSSEAFFDEERTSSDEDSDYDPKNNPLQPLEYVMDGEAGGKMLLEEMESDLELEHSKLNELGPIALALPELEAVDHVQQQNAPIIEENLVVEEKANLEEKKAEMDVELEDDDLEATVVDVNWKQLTQQQQIGITKLEPIKKRPTRSGTKNPTESGFKSTEFMEMLKKKNPPVPAFVLKHATKYSTTETPSAASLFWYSLKEVGLLETVVYYTNQNIEIKIEENHLKGKKKKWKLLTNRSLVMFYIVVLRMGVFKCTGSAETYFNNQYGLDCVRELMSRDVYKYIKRYIKFYEVTTQKELLKDPVYSDKSFKLEKLIVNWNQFWRQWWIIEKDLAVDERMIPCHSRTKLKRKIKNKVHPVGMKMILLCNNAGFCFFMLMDCAKNREKMNQLRNQYKQQKLGDGACWMLLICKEAKLERKNLWMDKFYNSVEGNTILLKDFGGNRAAGTLRRNAANVPHEQLQQGLKSGEFKIYGNKGGVNSDVVLLGFKDGSKYVPMISTIWLPDYFKQEEVKSSKKKKLKPALANQYTQNMGGVDKHDLISQRSTSNRQSRSWVIHGLYSVLDQVVTNCLLMLKQSTNKELKKNGAKPRQIIKTKIDFLTKGLDELVKGIVSEENAKTKPSRNEKTAKNVKFKNGESTTVYKHNASDLKACKSKWYKVNKSSPEPSPKKSKKEKLPAKKKRKTT